MPSREVSPRRRGAVLASGRDKGTGLMARMRPSPSRNRDCGGFCNFFDFVASAGETRPGVSPARSRRLPPARFLALAKRLMGEPASGAHLPQSQKSCRRGAESRLGARPRPSSRAIRRLQGGVGRRIALEEDREGCAPAPAMPPCACGAAPVPRASEEAVSRPVRLRGGSPGRRRPCRRGRRTR